MIAGPIGTGKTHPAIALGVEAARRRVAFVRAADRVRELVEARDELTLSRLHQIGMRAGLLLTADTRLRREHGLTWDRISRGPRVARRSLER